MGVPLGFVQHVLCMSSVEWTFLSVARVVGVYERLRQLAAAKHTTLGSLAVNNCVLLTYIVNMS